MRTSLWAAMWFMVATLTACGSGSSVQGPEGLEEPDSPAGDLSFASIAGAWEGPGTEPELGTNFWIRVQLMDSADAGEQVGNVGYYRNRTIVTALCGGVWNAISAEGHTYTVHEEVTNRPDLCVDGTVVLEYDPANDLIDFRFSPDNNNPDLFAEGELNREEDS